MRLSMGVLSGVEGRWRAALVRAAYAAVVLAVVGITAQLIATQRVDPAVFIGLAVALVVGVRVLKLGRFEYGILAIVLTAGLVNFVTLPTGRESRVAISLAIYLILLAVWILQVLFHRGAGPRLRPSPINKPLLAFVAINFIAYVWGNLMRDPLITLWPSFPNTQIAAFLVNIGLPLLSLMVLNKLKDPKWIAIIVWTIVGLGAFRVVTEIWSLPTDSLGLNGARGLFPMWGATLAFALALFDKRLKPWQRAALLVVTGMWFYRTAVQGTGWLSGWMPMVIAIAIVAFVRSRKLFAVLSVLALLMVAMNFDNYYERVVVSNEQEGSTSRLGIWEMNLRHVANHPLFGMGPAGYAPYNMHYHPTDARSTHNNYFDILAQNGVIGFISFAVMMGAFIVIGVRNVRATRAKHNFEAGVSAATLAGCIGALVGMALGDWVLPFAYNQTITGFDNAAYTWILLGCAASLYAIRSERMTTDHG